MISRADAVVGIVGESEISPWVREEMEAAASSDKPVFALLMPGASSAGVPENARPLRFDTSKVDSSTIVELLQQVKTG
jgi:hypothetical protein